MNRKLEDKPGYKIVYCRYIVRKGKKIYPKGAKCFCFYVPVKN